MDENKRETRTLVLMLLLAGWLLAYGTSIYALLSTPDIAAATLPALKRTVGFLGWQAVAGTIAFGCWGVGRAFPRGSGIGRVSAVPLAMAVALLVVISAMAVFGG
jgi:hypothetical protein